MHHRSFDEDDAVHLIHLESTKSNAFFALFIRVWFCSLCPKEMNRGKKNRGEKTREVVQLRAQGKIALI